MEMNITENLFSNNKKIFENSIEQSIDTDISLPDYYPEVEKILKCYTEVNILSKQIKDGYIIIGGQAVITLFYCDNEKRLNSHIHTYPFSKSIDAKLDSDDGFIDVDVRINYLNSKATAPRKIEIHGSLGMNLAITCVNNEKIISDIECDGFYSKTHKISYEKPLCPISKNIFVEDDINIPQSSNPVGKVVRSEATVLVSDCKIISGKAVVKGELCVTVFYTDSENYKLCKVSENFGFSQVIDSDDFDEFSICDVCAEVISLDTHPKTSLDGDIKSINIESKIEINIFGHKSTEITLITDAFSGNYLADIGYTDVIVEKLINTISEKYICNKNIDFTEGMLTSVLNMWGKVYTDFIAAENGEIVINGSLLINILGCNADNEPVFLDRNIDFECRFPVENEFINPRFKPCIKLVGLSYSNITDSSLELTAEISVKLSIFNCSNLHVVSNIKLDENSTVCKDCETAIILYFAEDESVWQIAKKYNTSPLKICEANLIDSFDEKCNKMLLIPNV